MADLTSFNVPTYSGIELQQLFNFCLSEKFILKNTSLADQYESPEQAKKSYELISVWYNWRNFLQDYKDNSDLSGRSFLGTDISTKEDYGKIYQNAYNRYLIDNYIDGWKRKIFDTSSKWTGDNEYDRFKRTLEQDYETTVTEYEKDLYLNKIKALALLYYPELKLNTIDFKRIFNQFKVLSSGRYLYVRTEDTSFSALKIYYELAYGMYTVTSDTSMDPSKVYYERIYPENMDTPFDKRLQWRGYEKYYGDNNSVNVLWSIYRDGEEIEYFPNIDSNTEIFWDLGGKVVNDIGKVVSCGSPSMATWHNSTMLFKYFPRTNDMTQPYDGFIKAQDPYLPQDLDPDTGKHRFYEKYINPSGLVQYLETLDTEFKRNKVYYEKRPVYRPTQDKVMNPAKVYYEKGHCGLPNNFFQTKDTSFDSNKTYFETKDVGNYVKVCTSKVFYVHAYYWEPQYNVVTFEPGEIYYEWTGAEYIKTLDTTPIPTKTYYFRRDTLVRASGAIVPGTTYYERVHDTSYLFVTGTSVGDDADGLYIYHEASGRWIAANYYDDPQLEEYVLKDFNIVNNFYGFQFEKASSARRWQLKYFSSSGSTITEDSYVNYFRFTGSSGKWSFIFSTTGKIDTPDALSSIITSNDNSMALKNYPTPINREWTEIAVNYNATTGTIWVKNRVNGQYNYDTGDESWLNGSSTENKLVLVKERGEFIFRDNSAYTFKGINDTTEKEYLDEEQISIFFDGLLNSSFISSVNSEMSLYKYKLEGSKDTKLTSFETKAKKQAESEAHKYAGERVYTIVTRNFVKFALSYEETNQYYIDFLVKTGYAVLNKDKSLTYTKSFGSIEHPDLNSLSDDTLGGSNHGDGYFLTSDTVMNPSKVYYEIDFSERYLCYKVTTDTKFIRSSKTYYEKRSSGYVETKDSTMDEKKIYYERIYYISTETSFDRNTEYYERTSMDQYFLTKDEKKDPNKDYYVLSYQATTDSRFVKRKDYYEAQSYNTVQNESKVAAILMLVKARIAPDNRVIFFPSTLSEKIQNAFLQLHTESLYYFDKVLYSEGFAMYNKYWNFKNFMVVLMTIEKMITRKLVTTYDVDAFTERDISNMFASYGLSLFEVIPLKYRRRILKNVNHLLSNKGTGKVLVDIVGIFGFENVKLFKHYLFKSFTYNDGKNDISKALKPSADGKLPRIKNQYGEDEIIDLTKLDSTLYMMKAEYDRVDLEHEFANIDYNRVETYEEGTTVDAPLDSTECDKYWVAEQKEVIGHVDNFLATKYFSFEIGLDMVRNKLNKSYIFDMVKQYQNINPDGLRVINTTLSPDPISIYDLMVLMYIASMKYMGFADDIVRSETAMESLVYGFNMTEYDEEHEPNNEYSYLRSAGTFSPLKKLMKDMGPRYFAYFMTEYIKDLHEEHKLWSYSSSTEGQFYTDGKALASGQKIYDDVGLRNIAGVIEQVGDTYIIVNILNDSHRYAHRTEPISFSKDDFKLKNVRLDLTGEVFQGIPEDYQKVLTTVLMLDADLAHETVNAQETISIINTCMSLLKTNNVFIGVDYTKRENVNNGYETLLNMINRGIYSTNKATHEYSAKNSLRENPTHLARINSIVDTRDVSFDVNNSMNTFQKVYLNNMRLLDTIKEYAKKQTNIVLFQALRKVHDINFTRYVEQSDFENYDTYTDYLSSRNTDLVKYLNTHEAETVLYEVFDTFSRFLADASGDDVFDQYFDLMQSSVSIGYIKKFIKIVIDQFKSYTVQFKGIDTYYIYKDDYDEKVWLMDDVTHFDKTLAVCSCSEHPYLNYLALKNGLEYLNGLYRERMDYCHGNKCIKCRFGTTTGNKDKHTIEFFRIDAKEPYTDVELTVPDGVKYLYFNFGSIGSEFISTDKPIMLSKFIQPGLYFRRTDETMEVSADLWTLNGDPSLGVHFVKTSSTTWSLVIGTIKEYTIVMTRTLPEGKSEITDIDWGVFSIDFHTFPHLIDDVHVFTCKCPVPRLVGDVIGYIYKSMVFGNVPGQEEFIWDEGNWCADSVITLKYVDKDENGELVEKIQSIQPRNTLRSGWNTENKVVGDRAGKDKFGNLTDKPFNRNFNFMTSDDCSYIINIYGSPLYFYKRVKDGFNHFIPLSIVDYRDGITTAKEASEAKDSDGIYLLQREGMIFTKIPDETILTKPTCKDTDGNFLETSDSYSYKNGILYRKRTLYKWTWTNPETGVLHYAYTFKRRPETSDTNPYAWEWYDDTSTIHPNGRVQSYNPVQDAIAVSDYDKPGLLFIYYFTEVTPVSERVQMSGTFNVVIDNKFETQKTRFSEVPKLLPLRIQSTIYSKDYTDDNNPDDMDLLLDWTGSVGHVIEDYANTGKPYRKSTPSYEGIFLWDEDTSTFIKLSEDTVLHHGTEYFVKDVSVNYFHSMSELDFSDGDTVQKVLDRNVIDYYVDPIWTESTHRDYYLHKDGYVKWDRNIDGKWKVEHPRDTTGYGTSGEQAIGTVVPENDIWIYQLVSDFTYMTFYRVIISRSRHYLPYNKPNKNHIELWDPIKPHSGIKTYEPMMFREFFKVTVLN